MRFEINLLKTKLNQIVLFYLIEIDKKRQKQIYRCTFITLNISNCCSPSFSPMATIVLLCFAMLTSIKFIPTAILDI